MTVHGCSVYRLFSSHIPREVTQPIGANICRGCSDRARGRSPASERIGGERGRRGGQNPPQTAKVERAQRGCCAKYRRTTHPARGGGFTDRWRRGALRGICCRSDYTPWAGLHTVGWFTPCARGYLCPKPSPPLGRHPPAWDKLTPVFPSFSPRFLLFKGEGGHRGMGGMCPPSPLKRECSKLDATGMQDRASDQFSRGAAPFLLRNAISR